MSSKVLILNNKNENNFKAILNLKNGEKCAIKFFNLKQKYKSLALGIKQSSTVLKIPLDLKGENCEFICDGLDLSKDFTCAVVDVSNVFCPEILLSASGSSGIDNCNIESAFVQSKPSDTSSLYTQDSQKDIEDLIDANLEDDISSTYYDACAKCKYREAFYKDSEIDCQNLLKNKTVQNTQNNAKNDKKSEKTTENEQQNDNLKHFCDENCTEETVSKLEVIEDNASTISSVDGSLLQEINLNQNEYDMPKGSRLLDDDKTFYEQISPQIDALFLKYNKDETLENKIPNSSWVKVTYDENGNFYVLGLVYDENKNVKYICYGMPSNDPSVPPDDLREYASWIDVEGAVIKGYWIVSQDSLDGKTLKNNLV